MNDPHPHSYAEIPEDEYPEGSVWERVAGPYGGALVTILGRHALQGLLRATLRYTPRSKPDGCPIEIVMAVRPDQLKPLSAVRRLALLGEEQ